MARRRRNTSTFSLAFLDIMSCGLGAAVLLFLLLRHVVDSPVPEIDPRQLSEIDLLEEEILEGEKNLVRIRNTISEISDESVVAKGLARKIQEDVDELKSLLEEIQPDSAINIPGLKAKIARLERQKLALETAIPDGNKAYEFTGDGDRQYLTGLKLGGENVLILVDSSASMLDETIVNIVRRRNMRAEQKSLAPKWQRTRDIVRWVIANLPLSSDFQILSFNKEVRHVFGDQLNEWHEVGDRISVAAAVDGVNRVIPQHGTNLDKAFVTAMTMTPKPDNIVLITDGLPTLSDDSNITGSITGVERYRLFNQSIQSLVPGVPVNTFLLPLEGDPYAAGAFWRLAIVSRGAFITPARDWP